MPLYCDTNLLIRLYVNLPESAAALRHLERIRRRSASQIPITWLHQLEINNAFEQLVFLARSGQGMRFTPETAALALAQFDDDLTSGLGLATATLPQGNLVKQARDLSQRHTARHGFRAYAVAHVSSALLLGCDEFWSFDVKAGRLAALEGLKVLPKTPASRS